MPQVTFHLHFNTQWGERLLLEIRPLAEDKSMSSPDHRPMTHMGQGCWTLSMAIPPSGAPLEYRYVVANERGDYQREPVFRRTVVTDVPRTVYDEWLPPELPEMVFLRQAFAGTIFQPDNLDGPISSTSCRHAVKISVRAPRVMRGYRLCVSGNRPFLGDWDPARALVMSGHDYPLWVAVIPRCEMGASLEFKFGLWSDREKRLETFEEGPNRELRDLPADQAVEFNVAYFRHRATWKGAGVAVPVFSLRSESGYGIGEFPDLEPLANWAADCGLHLIQILPVNDTISDFSWRDSYPYKAISAMALHPIYLNIEQLFAASHEPLPADYHRRREALNRLPHVDYEAVLKDKLTYLRQLFRAVGQTVMARADFTRFFAENEHWLKPYAAFCRLRDQYATADFTRWGDHAQYSEAKISPWFNVDAPEHSDVAFYCFVQLHLEQQLRQAIGAGRARGIAFKGDLPIGIDRCSVEAWTEPDLFHMDRQTGAPPDSFAVLGQNWGFPTYRWPKMAEDGYAWWRRRFQKMSAYFDAIRIDHILGFFRIWEIPGQYAEGIMGHFNPALPLSRDEIRQYGINRDPGLFTRSAIAEAKLGALFGQDTDKAAHHFLYRDQDGYFRLKSEFESAENRSIWYVSNCDNAQAARIEEAVKRLGFEVLFLEDADHPARFHPRIAPHQTLLFASLAPPERDALKRLHDDFFYHRHNRFWEVEAMKKLPALMDSTRMLICGEDLGMIPDSVPVVLKRLGILSLEVQRMPKSSRQAFAEPAHYPYLSVCTTSTHDMATLRGWWEEEPETRQRFHQEVMHRSGEAPEACGSDICEWVVRQHLDSTSMWCVLPLQDWLAIDPQLRHPEAAVERVNVPAIPRHYWRYRMHLTVEQLRKAEAFNRRLAGLVAESGRHPTG